MAATRGYALWRVDGFSARCERLSGRVKRLPDGLAGFTSASVTAANVLDDHSTDRRGYTNRTNPDIYPREDRRSTCKDSPDLMLDVRATPLLMLSGATVESHSGIY